MPRDEKYNLQRVLEMRARAQDEAAVYLADCRRELSVAEKELENRRRAVEDCRLAQRRTQAQMIERSTGGIRQSELARFRQHLADLRENESALLAAVGEQEKVVSRAEQAVEKALVKLTEAAKETKVIEKHRENWQTARKKESARREQKSNDEIGAILHESNKSD